MTAASVTAPGVAARPVTPAAHPGRAARRASWTPARRDGWRRPGGAGCGGAARGARPGRRAGPVPGPRAPRRSPPALARLAGGPRAGRAAATTRRRLRDAAGHRRWSRRCSPGTSRASSCRCWCTPPGPPGPGDRHVHRLLRAGHGRGAAAPTGRVVACEIDADVAAFAQALLREFRERRTASTSGWGRPRDTLRQLAAAGQRLRPGVRRRRQGGLHRATSRPCWRPGCSPRTGCVCVDNTLMQGQPWSDGEPTANGAAIAAFNRCGRRRPPRRAGRRPAAGRPHPDPPGGRRTPCSMTSWTPWACEVSDLPLEQVDADDVQVLRAPAGRARRRRAARAGRRRRHVPVASCERFGDLTFSAGEKPLDGFPDLNVISNVGPHHAAAQRLPRRHQLRRAARRRTRRCGRCRSPSRAARRCSPTSTAPTTRCPRTCASGSPGRTLRHVVTGLDLGDDDETEAEHPVFAAHPVSGRTALFMSTPERCVSVSGLDEAEGRELVSALYEHSTREDNVLRHAWAPGDVVMWDNRCVLHRADHADVVGDRVMHRGMVTARDLTCGMACCAPPRPHGGCAGPAAGRAAGQPGADRGGPGALPPRAAATASGGVATPHGAGQRRAR